MSWVEGPSRGTLKYWTKQHMKKNNLSEEDAKDLAYSIWCEHHQSCRKASYRHLKKAFEPYVREYVSFFVGPQQYDTYKKAYDDLWQNRLTKHDHRFLRPWYDTAYQFFKRGKSYDDSQSHPMADISQQHRVTRDVHCTKCNATHPFAFALGAILKLVVGGISRDDWDLMLNDKYHVSHLSGISDDGNPLNHILEPQAHNNSRKTCHHSNNLAAHPEKIVCSTHAQPCFLAAARMTGCWPKVTAEMIRQREQGHPAINAFDLVEHKMFS